MDNPCEPSQHKFGEFLEPQTKSNCIHCGMHRDNANAEWRAKYLNKSNKV